MTDDASKPRLSKRLSLPPARAMGMRSSVTTQRFGSIPSPEPTIDRPERPRRSNRLRALFRIVRAPGEGGEVVWTEPAFVKPVRRRAIARAMRPQPVVEPATSIKRTELDLRPVTPATRSDATMKLPRVPLLGNGALVLAALVLAALIVAIASMVAASSPH